MSVRNSTRALLHQNCPKVQLLQPTSAHKLFLTLPNPQGTELGCQGTWCPCLDEGYCTSRCFCLRSRHTLRGRIVLRKNRSHAIRTALSIFPARIVILP